MYNFVIFLGVGVEFGVSESGFANQCRWVDDSMIHAFMTSWHSIVVLYWIEFLNCGKLFDGQNY